MARVAESDLVDPIFVERWSPRAFTDEPVTDAELAAVFEAARWAPSWMNNQPWIYLYATTPEDRQAMLSVFMDYSLAWVSKAPVVGLVLAKTELEGFMGRTRDFDTGAATMSMALQANRLGLHMHLVGGIVLDAAYELTGADRDTTEILAGFVIGRRGDPADLPEGLREREAPNDRNPVSSFAHCGTSLPQ